MRVQELRHLRREATEAHGLLRIRKGWSVIYYSRGEENKNTMMIIEVVEEASEHSAAIIWCIASLTSMLVKCTL